MPAWKGWTVALLLLVAAPSHAQDAPAPRAPAADAPGDSVFDALDGQPLLRKLNFRLVPDGGPVALAILPAFPANEEHIKQLTTVLGEFAAALFELFRTDYAGPAGQAPREDRERLLIVTLDRPELFAKLRDEAGVHDARDEQAFFAPKLPGVIVLDPGAAEGLPGALDLVRPMCHAAVHALLEACVPPGGKLPLWMEEGLAERLSANTGRLPAKRESLRIFDAEALTMLASADEDPVWRVAAQRSLTELVAVTTPAELAAQTQGSKVPVRTALRGLGHGASLFLCWLDEPKLGHMSNEELKEVWKGRKLVQAVLAGQPCAEALPAILGQDAPATLDEGFAGWKKERLDERDASRDRTQAAREIGKLAEAAAAPAAPTSAVVTGPALLAVPSTDATIAHARALQRASDGDLRGALAALDELLARPDLPADVADAVLVERRVGKQLEDLRRRWAGEHTGKSLELRDGAATLRTTLVSVQGDVLVVKEGGRQRELPLDALLPGTLAAQLFAPDTQLSPADDEARALAWLLAADETWKDHSVGRSRKESAPDGLALLARRPAFDASLRVGRVVAALDALAVAEPPVAGHSQDERDAWLARASTVLAARELPVVAERLAALRTLAGDVLDAAFDAAPLEHLDLHAKVETLDGGRVRASWDFADAGQLRDFSAVTLREEDIGRLRPIRVPPAGPAGLAVESHQLVLRGRGQWRCALPLDAPLSAVCELQYRRTPDEGPGARSDLVAGVMLRLCADPFGSYLECEGLGHLTVFDKLAGASQWAEPVVGGSLPDTWYQVRVEHDGQKLRAQVDGVQVSAAPVARRTQGFVELMHNTERPIAVRLLVLEGAPDLDALAPVRGAWVAGQLAALGAGP